MSHTVGERFHCDECGAEIVFIKACPCPESEPKKHADICCGQEMRRLGVDELPEAPRKASGL